MNYWAAFKRLVSCIPGTVSLYEHIMGLRKPDEIRKYSLSRGTVPKPDFSWLEKEYQKNRIAQEPDNFVIYRVIGNDLPPRHRKGQSRNNLRFILANEPDFPRCEKRFIINRIVDPEEEQTIIRLIEECGFKYLRIPFRIEEYTSLPWDISGVPVEYAPYTKKFAALSEAEQDRVLMRIYLHKNNYVMNNNGARNAALSEGRQLAKWILPWDGNCFITEKAWHEIVQAVQSLPHIPYFVVPMTRITDNRLLLDPQFAPDPVEEPQIFFRRDASLCFNEEFFYGRRPKVELFWRLGVPGDWEHWQFEPWDMPGPENYAKEAGYFAYAGWVARLDSGQADLEGNSKQGKMDRGLARNAAIAALLDQLDKRAMFSRRLNKPLVTGASSISHEFMGKVQQRQLSQLFKAAKEALGRGPYSVMNKTTLAPSGDPHDYWHPAPYYWPNPLKPSGKPYISRDGKRVPGTRLYEPGSDKYDRTRLQRLFDDTFILALAWHFHGDKRFADHAVCLVRQWFLDPATAMNPSLEYAQVRPGHNNDRGSSWGIIEMKDLYFFLDAVRILEIADVFSRAEQRKIRQWFEQYLKWLKTSPRGARNVRQKITTAFIMICKWLPLQLFLVKKSLFEIPFVIAISASLLILMKMVDNQRR